MVTAVQSFTNASTEYNVTINEQGLVTDCSCKDFYYRGGACKHMSAKQEEVNTEIDRARCFLAACTWVQGKEETWRANYEMSRDSRFA